MSRRYIATFVLAALLVVPAMALGLPRPTGAPTTGETFVETVTLSANGTAVQSAALVNGRTYRLQVSGTWRHGAPTNSVADARWATNDGWITCLQTGKGLQVGAIKMGDPASDLSCNKASHSYSITIVGRGVGETMKVFDDTTYNDNLGSLNVSVFLQSSVTFVFELNFTQQPPQSPVPQPYTTVTVPPITPGAIPAVTISAIPVPGGGAIPYIGTVTYNHSCGQPREYCIFIQVQQMPPMKLGSVVDELNLLPNGATAIGGTGQLVSPTTVGPFSPVPGGTPLPPIPGQEKAVGLPPGTTLTITITWRADTTKLTRAAAFGNGDEYQLWAPFAPIGDSAWFAGTLLDGTTEATIRYTLKDSSGNAIAPSQSASVPGLGQVLEAVFASRAAGH